MKRSRSCETKGLKKGVWTEEEDQKLLAYVKKHGEGGWRLLPQKAGLMRCGKSCRLRWANYLRPGIRRGEFTPEEEQTIIRLHAVLGNRWATIARHLYRRTDNEIKNHWNTRLKKHVANATNIASTVDDTLADSNIPNNLADKSDHIAVTTNPTQAHDSENNNNIFPISVEHVVLAPSTSLTSSNLLLPNLHFPNDNNNNNNNNNNNTNTTKTSISDFDPQDSGANSTASSARVLNKIASKMGRLNLRYALVGCAAAANEGMRSGTVSSSTAGFDSRSPAATDSSTTSNDVEAATFEDYASLFQQSGANVSEQGMEDELFRLQSLYSSYSWSDFGDNIVLDDDLDQVFFPSLRNGDSE